MEAMKTFKSKFEVGQEVVQDFFNSCYTPSDSQVSWNQKVGSTVVVLKVDFDSKTESFYYLCEYFNGQRMWMPEDKIKG